MGKLKMCSKAVIFLLVQIRLSWGEVFEKCSVQNRNCEQSSNKLSCNDGVIQLTSFTFIFEKGQRDGCCKMQSDCTDEAPPLYKKVINDKCAGEPSCSIPGGTIFAGVRDLNVDCKESDSIISAKIVYKCIPDETTKALPATGNSDNTGQGGGTSMLVVPIIVALAALLIIAAIFGVVIYRRQSRRKGNTGNNTQQQEISNGERNIGLDTQEQEIANGERNIGLEDEYNTIPADYEEMPQKTYQKLGESEASKEHMYLERRRDDSMKYSTIVLYEQTETDSKNYGYDSTKQNKRYEANKLTDQDNLHSYGHFSETSDSYSKLETNINRHNLEKDYSHFEPESLNDYSHLNDKKDLTHVTYNEYSHLQTKKNPIRPVKRVDSYEQPVLNCLPQKNDVLREPKCDQKMDERGTSVNEVKRFPLVTKVDGRIKRKDSYEEPVLITNIVKNEPKESSNTRDDYEAPVSLKETSVNNFDVPKNHASKRKDSYEKPVLRDVSERKQNVNIIPKHDSELEDQERLKDNYTSDTLFSGKTEGRDSYETPVLKSTVGMPGAPMVNSAMSDDNCKQLSLQASEYYPENATVGTPTHTQVRKVDSYEKPELKIESGIDVSYKLQNEKAVTACQF